MSFNLFKWNDRIEKAGNCKAVVNIKNKNAEKGDKKVKIETKEKVFL